ncbi:MAG: formate dehydrogenase subunit delta [Methylocystis sp.]
MSHSTSEHLVKMANQIGDFFSSQKTPDNAAGVADHINKFWDPRMRAGIVDHVAHGGEGLKPIVIEAIKRLARTQGAGSK